MDLGPGAAACEMGIEINTGYSLNFCGLFPVAQVPRWPKFPGGPSSQVAQVPSGPSSQVAQVPRCPSSRWPKFPVAQVPRWPKFPGAQVPGGPSSRWPKFPVAEVPSGPKCRGPSSQGHLLICLPHTESFPTRNDHQLNSQSDKIFYVILCINISAQYPISL